ncbi:MAG TPA: deoxyguanosinetriphosphate triphosphohydrolase, partial [bacterium]|nr:deoxyguanosinetriphosphate triphosphohydrolase [bacterium]
MKDFGGYEHNRQGLRVVTKLEKRYPEFDGLNLTFEVREGIIKHVSEYDQPEVQEYDPKLYPTLEAQVVNLADEIAYTSHDVDDGLKAGLISAEDLDRVRLWRDLYGKVSGRGLEPELARYAAVRDLINLLVTDLLEQTGRNISGRRIRSVEAVRRQAQPLVEFSPATARKHQELKKFLYENMYRHHRVIRMSEKAKRIIGDLFKVYTKQPKQLPPQVAGRISSAEPAARVVCDYIAGMTDNFALEEYQKLFDPFTRV